MRRIAVLAGVVLVVAGALIALPLAVARWRYSAAAGTIDDVLLEPVGAGQVRLHVLLEFTVIDGGDHVTYHSAGDNLADDRYRRIEDPVLPQADAEARARALRGDDPRLRPGRTVLYSASDPAGTAFIVSDAAGGTSRRYETGLALIAGGLLLAVGWRRRGADA
jgi:hypothetical protein